MKNPTPGKNPFELESYRDKMPLHVRELYDDMTRNYAKLQGRLRKILEVLGVCSLLYRLADGHIGHNDRHDSRVCRLGSLRLALHCSAFFYDLRSPPA